MWFRGIGFGVVLMLLTYWTSSFGGLISLLAWGIVLARCWQKRSWKIPMALSLFTAAVCVPFFALHVLSWGFWYDVKTKAILEVSLTPAMELAFIIVSFLCLLLSLVFLYGYRGPGRRTLQVGSIVLIVVDCLGFITLILSLPGMPMYDGG